MRELTVLLGAFLFLTSALAETAGGIQWTSPAGWKSMGQRPMRIATYGVPAAGGDKEDAECGVFYFGPGQGGSVQANLERWIGQFEQPDGRPSRDVAQIGQRTIGGFAVTTIDLVGTFTGAGGLMGPKVSKPDYRLLGAIVEAPEGPVFFKFTGPAKTVSVNEPVFRELIGSVRR